MKQKVKAGSPEVSQKKDASSKMLQEMPLKDLLLELSD